MDERRSEEGKNQKMQVREKEKIAKHPFSNDLWLRRVEKLAR
jgi:hypothetical protein